MHDFIRGIFLNPAAGIARETLVEERCDDFYTLLDCNVIDIVTRSVGGKAFSIVCDDEGLLKPDPCISAPETPPRRYGKRSPQNIRPRGKSC